MVQRGVRMLKGNAAGELAGRGVHEDKDRYGNVTEIRRTLRTMSSRR